MDHKEFSRLGAAATNKIYTTEKRKRAALLGWKKRKLNKKYSKKK